VRTISVFAEALILAMRSNGSAAFSRCSSETKEARHTRPCMTRSYQGDQFRGGVLYTLIRREIALQAKGRERAAAWLAGMAVGEGATEGSRGGVSAGAAPCMHACRLAARPPRWPASHTAGPPAPINAQRADDGPVLKQVH
jgi:hypothetical protein